MDDAWGLGVCVLCFVRGFYTNAGTGDGLSWRLVNTDTLRWGGLALFAR